MRRRKEQLPGSLGVQRKKRVRNKEKKMTRGKKNVKKLMGGHKNQARGDVKSGTEHICNMRQIMLTAKKKPSKKNNIRSKAQS